MQSTTNDRAVKTLMDGYDSITMAHESFRYMTTIVRAISRSSKEGEASEVRNLCEIGLFIGEHYNAILQDQANDFKTVLGMVSR